MAQLSYSQTTAAAFAGMKADAQFDYVKSAPAQAQIDFGLGLVRAQGDVSQVRRPLRNQVALVLDADLVAANVYAFDLVIGGVTTAISETFAVDHDTTMAALAAQVAAVDGVVSAVVSDANNRTLTIITEDATVDVVNAAVTGGASQAGITETNSSTDTAASVVGIALHEQRESLVGYLANDAVNVLSKGAAWVPCIDTVAAGDDVYISYAPGSEGKFRNDNTSAIQVTGAVFDSAGTNGGLVKVQINKP